jgi:predicted ATPase
MAAPYLEELRLTRFKSFRDAVLPLRDLTLLIGRNGSGKSNAIDGLQLLAKLAQGEDIRDAIEGSRSEGSEVRGGTRGCAPFGDDSFELGCRVRSGDETLELDVRVQVEPNVQITMERLWSPEGGDERRLLATDPPEADRADIMARYDNGKRGKNPALPFRSSRLLTTQVATRVPTSGKAMRRVHDGAETVIEALQAVFVLDPVPPLMRQYVPSRDTLLRRQADNLSAAVGALLRQPETATRLRELVRSLPEQTVDDISVESSSLGDVIIALEERLGRRCVPVSARVMSDGMLRFIAFATALLEAPLLDEDAGPDRPDGRTMLIIEEVENGLHPSQAARVVDLIRAESRRRRVRTLATTHSPAILTALDPDDHAGVVVCSRDRDSGESRLTRLIDVASYPRAMAAGTLGDAVTQRRLEGEQDQSAALRSLDAVLAEL